MQRTADIPPYRPSDRWERLYKRLLRLYPGSFREEYGQELLETFRDSLDRLSNRRKVCLVWVRTLADLLISVPPERLCQLFNRISGHSRRGHSKERFMDSLLQDIRYAFRSLSKNPGLTLVFVFTLALGVGANTAVFAVLNSMIFRPLPVPDPHQLTVVATIDETTSTPFGLAYADYRDYRDQVQEFSSLAAYQIGFEGLSTGNQAQRITVSYVTDNFFSMLGIEPALGQFIRPHPGSEKNYQPVLVLGHSFWENFFGADAGIIGETVRINGKPVRVIGVAPHGFQGTYYFLKMDGYLHLGMELDRSEGWEDRQGSHLHAIGRRKPEVSLEQLRASLQVVSAGLEKEYPKLNRGEKAVAYPENWVRPEANTAEWWPVIATVFLTLVLLVLFVASANGLNLMLVHATVREQSMAVRAALGAGRARLVRQFLTETVLMSALGGLAGLALGAWVCRLLESLPLNTDLPVRLDFGLDWRVYAYIAMLSIVTGLLVGVVPAFRSTRTDVHATLGSAGRTLVGGRGRRLRSGLVIAQVAVSVMLLIVAGLFVRGLGRARNMDLGFRPQGILNLSLDPGQNGYSQEQGRAFYRELEQKVRALAGVESASYAYSVPAGYNFSSAAVIPDGRIPQPDETTVVAGFNRVSSGYFETMQIEILRGRPFQPRDRADAPLVAIVNSPLAQTLWPDQDPLGKRFSYKGQDGPYLEVVGICREGRFGFLLEEPQRHFFVPLEQDYTSLRTLQVRTLGIPESLAPQLRELIRSLDPNLAAFSIRSMEQTLEGANGFFLLNLSAGFGAGLGVLGLLLAGLGVYGVVSYASSQRTHEIGIRMALGARRGDVLRLISRQGLVLVLLGVLIGLAAALAFTQVLSSLLFGVDPRDLLTFIAVPLILAAAGLTAAVLPARKASRVDPMAALRTD
ncbi:MAG: ABC transporter permease [Acidobacteriota bacterium]